MNPDFNAFGIFVNGGLASAILGFGLHLVVRRLLASVGLYRFFWHPALVNVALFVIWWGVVAIGLSSLPALSDFFLD